MISFSKYNEHSSLLNVPWILTSKGSPFSLFSSTNKMEASLGNIARWILAALLVFASLQRSDQARSFTKEPNNPTMVVEGVNTSSVRLVWEYGALNDQESINQITIERGRPGSSERTLIAYKRGNDAFTLQPGVDTTKYEALLPLTLELSNVNNNEEYIYFIELSLNSGGLQILNSQARIIVNVPPRITVEPTRQSYFDVGQNRTLTCNASGDPPPNITWTREGVPQNQFNASGYRLHLVNVQREDVGSYKCTANNGYGIATFLAIVNVNCPSNQCEVKTVGIKIISKQWEWKQAYSNKVSVEFKMLESNLTSEIVKVYNLPQNTGKRLYKVAVDYFRSGSTEAILQLQFHKDATNPLKPLEDEVADGRLGQFEVEKQLVINPTSPPSTTSTTEASTGTTQGPDTGARSSGLTDAEMWGIIGGCIAFAIVVVIIILIVCICKKKKAGGATKGKSYSEADGYRMNRQPPPSGLGTASPAYVEARMYAPANATRKQDDQPKQLNYADLSFDKSSGKPPPPYGSGTVYSEMSPEKRPPPAGGGGGGQQGEGGGFELWC